MSVGDYLLAFKDPLKVPKLWKSVSRWFLQREGRSIELYSMDKALYVAAFRKYQCQRWGTLVGSVSSSRIYTFHQIPDIGKVVSTQPILMTMIKEKNFLKALHKSILHEESLKGF